MDQDWGQRRGHLAPADGPFRAEQDLAIVAPPGDVGGDEPFDVPFVNAAVVVDERPSGRQLLSGGRPGDQHERKT